MVNKHNMTKQELDKQLEKFYLEPPGYIPVGDPRTRVSGVMDFLLEAACAGRLLDEKEFFGQTSTEAGD